MRFKRVYIEITNTCNLACSFCIQNQRQPRRMNIQEFTHVIQEVRSVTRHVYLHVLGEPLSHPDLPAFLQICKANDMEVILTTNGTLLKKQVDALCASQCIRQLNISLHSFPQHEQPRYLETIWECAEKLAACGIHVNYRLWSIQDEKLSKETQTLLTTVVKQYQKNLEDVMIKRMHRFDLADHIHLHFENIFTWPSLMNPFVLKTGSCLGMKSMCGVLVDGTLVPCCLDSKGDIALGNLFETPLEEILSSKRCLKMLEGFQKHQVEEALCQHCTYRLRFL